MKLKILMCLLLVAGVAYAANEVVNKYPDRSIQELDAISSAENADLAHSSYASRVILLEHNQTVTVNALFSNASATASIGIVRGKMRGTTFVPSGSVNFATFTADTTYTVGGKYIANSVAFDTSNYEAAFIFVKSISAGSVTPSWSRH